MKTKCAVLTKYVFSKNHQFKHLSEFLDFVDLA